MEGIKISRFLMLARTSAVLIAVVFAIGFMANDASATAPPVPTGLYISVTSTNYLTFSWSGGTADSSTVYILATSTDGVTFVTSTQATSTPAGSGLGNNASSTWSGLTANTQYWFRVAAGDGVATSTYVSVNGYTLATAPTTAPTANVTGPSIIAVSWSDVGATSYYAENITAGTNSGWTAGLVWSSTGLSCNTSYSFRVKGKNAEGEVTDWSDTGIATVTCGSGTENSTPATPAVPATPATPATPEVETPATPAAPAAPASVVVSNTPGSIIKVNASDRPAVYYVVDGKKYLFVNRATYTTWSSDAGDSANNFATLILVSQAEFDAIPTGGNLIAKPGSLIKFDNSPIIYAVATRGNLYQLADSAAQTALYGSAVPAIIQAGFREGYYDHGNAVGTLTASSQKPD
ncbi:MAG: hypothetical protein WC473_01145 [Patescibacteria group bacterium]